MTTENTDDIWIPYLVCIILSLMGLVILIGLGGVIKIELDNASQHITFIRFFSRKTIENSEIEGYYNCFYNAKKATYGRVIKTLDGKLRELHPANLKDMNIMDTYLNDNSIKFLGERKSFYPFTSGL
ncbi:hypothetical protein [Mucilaginibacter sp. PPCGB 2223]|uniref:hypothetical protein n=1 Tax=Mucilaginibacter sp. PPCGB 2223 TaxID=1886027 RepID=UPI001585F385|nr:hypothetical protein [Mucilaginibacter sp. PPCGB 2223]